jgi:hypothetical protein
MLVTRQERILAIDGVYIHVRANLLSYSHIMLMPGPDYAFN